MNPLMHATILLAHGSRDPDWKRPVEAIAARMQTLDPSCQVGCAYLENMQPDLGTCVTEWVQRGVMSVTVFPLFLGAGKHVRHDIGTLAQAVRLQHPSLAVNVGTMMGDHPEFTDLTALLALKTAALQPLVQPAVQPSASR